jgi:hypothetical protein
LRIDIEIRHHHLCKIIIKIKANRNNNNTIHEASQYEFKSCNKNVTFSFPSYSMECYTSGPLQKGKGKGEREGDGRERGNRGGREGEGMDLSQSATHTIITLCPVTYK